MPDCPKWFALRVRPRAEKFVSHILEVKGVPHFLPLYTARKRWADRYKLLELPLFPGYVFAHFDMPYRSLALSTPGVTGVVRIGNIPAPIEEHEITALQTVTNSRLQYLPSPVFEIGQPVTIVAGPLMGLSGRLVAIKNSVRLLLSVKLLQRSVLVEIDRDWALSLDTNTTIHADSL